MKRLTWFMAALLIASVLCSQAEAKIEIWKLDFKHTGLHYVRVGGRVIAYTTYTVTNNTGADREFAPIFRVETDTKRLTYTVPNPLALQRIRSKHGKKFLDINQVTGTIKSGETLQGAAIFYRLDPEADHVKVYILGLTNGFRYLDKVNRTGFQRREWFVHWFRPGDAVNRPADRVDTVKDEWIWRSTGVAATAPVDD